MIKLIFRFMSSRVLNNLQSGAVGQSGWKDLGRPAKEQAQT